MRRGPSEFCKKIVDTGGGQLHGAEPPPVHGNIVGKPQVQVGKILRDDLLHPAAQPFAFFGVTLDLSLIHI